MKPNRPRLLFLIGAVAPLNSTNANLMMKIIRKLSDECEIYTLSVGAYDETQLDNHCDSRIRIAKYSTVTHAFYSDSDRISFQTSQKAIYKAITRIIDRNGYQDAYDGLLLRDLIRKLDSKYHFHGICTSMEPYKTAYALSKVHTAAKKILYVIDPPADIVPGLEQACTPFRKSTSRAIVSKVDMLITTHRIMKAFNQYGYNLERTNVIAEEFPLFAPLFYNHNAPVLDFDPEKINLLYCGWLRHEEFLIKLIEYLDERFSITFIGNDNNRVANIKTKASVKVFPAVSHDTAVNTMLAADILVCIGNIYPVHIPSKVFEYISSGKPFVNLYTLPDCPTLEYTKMYPLALNLSTSMDPEVASAMFVAFCEQKKGASIPPEMVMEQYSTIDADKILRSICNAIAKEINIGKENIYES